jgi:hypothetical protein
MIAEFSFIVTGFLLGFVEKSRKIGGLDWNGRKRVTDCNVGFGSNFWNKNK